MTGERPGPSAGPGARNDRRAIAVVAAVAALAFASALGGGFVFDDTAFLPASEKLARIGNPLVFFRTGVWDHANVDAAAPLYRPAFMVVLWAGHALLGGSAWAWHAMLVAFHVAASVLVLVLARTIFSAAPAGAALAGALVFAVHPVHVEAVSWVLAFGHPLATALVVGAALLQLRGRPYAAAVLALTAPLVNEAALVAPLLVVAAELAVRGTVRGRTAALQACALGIALAMRRIAVAEVVPVAVSPGSLARAAEFGAAYLRQLVWPFPQHVYLEVPEDGVASVATWVVAIALIAGGAWAGVVAMRAGRRAIAFALGWVGLSTVPLVVGALNPRPLFAPRALYLATVGLALLVAAVVPGFTRARGAIAGALVAAGAIACNVAARGWRDDLAVYTRIVAATPRYGPAHVVLAEIALDREDWSSAERSFREALECRLPEEDGRRAQEGLARTLAQTGRLDEAERLLQGVVAAAPGAASAWIGLGNIAWIRRDAATARDRYVRALAADPRSFEAAHNASLASDALGRGDEAREYRARAEALGAAPR